MFVYLDWVQVHKRAHTSSGLCTWVGCKYTNARTSPRICSCISHFMEHLPGGGALVFSARNSGALAM